MTLSEAWKLPPPLARPRPPLLCFLSGGLPFPRPRGSGRRRWTFCVRFLPLPREGNKPPGGFGSLSVWGHAWAPSFLSTAFDGLGRRGVFTVASRRCSRCVPRGLSESDSALSWGFRRLRPSVSVWDHLPHGALLKTQALAARLEMPNPVWSKRLRPWGASSPLSPKMLRVGAQPVRSAPAAGKPQRACGWGRTRFLHRRHVSVGVGVKHAKHKICILAILK